MAAAALDDGFVAAYSDSSDPSAPAVILRVFSPEGQAAAEASFPTNEAWLGGDRLALLGGPGARSVLVAWVGHGSNGSEPGALRLRRYDCAGGN
ncbi:MAG: hypothetical protein IT372_22850 [Polyangiaceae bacterium]|nr:hypothetical protein [Polyangiaceae bacterium]